METNKGKKQRLVNSFIHNIEKWPNLLQKSCGVNTARFLSMFGHFLTL